jgi:CSLREA domain-containing protein
MPRIFAWRSKAFAAIVTTMLLVALPVNPAAAANATIPVNSTIDAPDANPGDGSCETAPGNGVCTLRAAVMEANDFPGADTIGLDSAEYVL